MSSGRFSESELLGFFKQMGFHYPNTRLVRQPDDSLSLQISISLPKPEGNPSKFGDAVEAAFSDCHFVSQLKEERDRYKGIVKALQAAIGELRGAQ